MQLTRAVVVEVKWWLAEPPLVVLVASYIRLHHHDYVRFAASFQAAKSRRESERGDQEN